MLHRLPVKGDYIRNLISKNVVRLIGDWRQDEFESEGRYFEFVDVTPSSAPIIVVRYLNIYNDGSTYLHDTKSEADKNATTRRVGCQKVVLVEGTYDA